MGKWTSFCVTVLIIALCFFGIPIHIDKPEEAKKSSFESFLKKYNKSNITDSVEYKRRFENFKQSLKIIQQLNSIQDSDEDMAVYGLTQYADLSQDEFLEKHLFKNYSKHSRKHKKHLLLPEFKKHHRHRFSRSFLSLPDEVDWREKRVVTPVKNQKSCGACWAFSIIETVESMTAIKYGKLETLSVQEAIDCARNGNLGCDGGDTCSLLEWLVDNNVKVVTEESYPLVLETGSCKLDRLSDGVQVASNFSCDNLIGYEDDLLALLANHGPVAVAVNALSWQFYLSGVIKYHCDATTINHAVQIVGYDRRGPEPYYIVRNSWGASFGENGYLKIAIGDNMCGLATEVSALDVL